MTTNTLRPSWLARGVRGRQIDGGSPTIERGKRQFHRPAFPVKQYAAADSTSSLMVRPELAASVLSRVKTVSSMFKVVFMLRMEKHIIDMGIWQCVGDPVSAIGEIAAPRSASGGQAAASRERGWRGGVAAEGSVGRGRSRSLGGDGAFTPSGSNHPRNARPFETVVGQRRSTN